MKSIYKYDVPLEGATHMIPQGALLQHVAVQYQPDVVSFWATVDTETLIMEERRFEIVGTGHLIPENGVYVGTAEVKVNNGGSLVWHLIEVPL